MGALLASLAGCSYSPPEIEGRPCPCPAAYSCVDGVCRRSSGGDGGGGGDGDGGSLPSADDAPTRRVEFVENFDNFLNPERGFFVGLNLPELLDGNFLAVDRRVTLTYDLVNIGEFREGNISSALLDGLQRGLDELRDSGASAILRFAYNEADGGEDATLSQILAHITQLSGILRRNVDVIAAMEAGFIGAYGEWRDSTSGNGGAAQQRAIVEALLEAVPGRTVLVRRPELKNQMYGGFVTAANAFSDMPIARVGHDNECLLASIDDLGTFAGSVERWRDFMKQDSVYVPVGGAMCQRSELTTCANVLEHLADYHFTFLSSDYDTAALGVLESEGCREDVERRLGYRFVLEEAAIPTEIRPGGSFRLELILRNKGYAAPMNQRFVYLVLDGNGVRHEVRLNGTDVRRYVPDIERHTISARVRLPADLAEGTYRLSIRIPSESESVRDRPEYAIRIASRDSEGDDIWAVGLNVLGEIEVASDAPGTADASAGELVQL